MPLHDCECTYNFTCRACLDRCVARNLADKNAAPPEPLKPHTIDALKALACQPDPEDYEDYA
jgi:hypothetical protein